MAVIGGVQIDEGLADILKKLKETDKKEEVKEKEDNPQEDQNNIDTNNITTLPTEKFSSTVSLDNDEMKVSTELNNDSLSDDILPWFKKSDKDTELIHYLKLDENGKVVSATVRADKAIGDLAAIKLKNNYLCDVDYYKSNHFVLFMKQLDSDYEYSRSFIATNEEASHNITIEDTKFIEDDSNNPELNKVPTENVAALVADRTKYTHYIVFTDLGVADFISNDDAMYLANSIQDLSKWFEFVSNNALIKNARFDRSSLLSMDPLVNSIRDYKYNLITIRRPGVFTLDSMDNDDSNYHLNIKLKDEFSFIPSDNILKCFKLYSNGNKSIDDLRKFIDRYFNII